MGNFEKSVVLIVLFLSAVVLAVSLNDGETAAGTGPTDPLQQAEQTEHTARPLDRPATATESGDERAPAARNEGETERPNLLLDATPKPPISSEVAGGPRRILKSEAGLRQSLLEDYREYVVREDDTWAALAQRFYRDARQVGRLQVANEDLEKLTPGRTILVPVYDLDAEAGDRASFRPIDRPSGERPAAETAPVVARPSLANTSDVDPGGTYTVVDGDSLSKIALKVYGSARRWEEIYEANKDVMKSADWLTLGMKLYIPREGEVTVPERAAASTEALVPVRGRVD